ncbi:hypothetical protein M426DRAFT_324375 [Hypoxylon sp. CI-4A]|nr:hypothetical protein M426DRAFT_324375 [Hypoxylon sp. CI-4A]
MSHRLCPSCKAIFIGLQILREPRPHHTSALNLINAAKDGCYVCSIIIKSRAWEAIEIDAPFNPTWYLTPIVGQFPGWFKLTIDAAPSEEELYQDFVEDESPTTEDEEDPFNMPNVPMWGFYLQPAADVENNIALSEPPAGLHSPEILHLAQTWLSRCNEDHPSCKPTRPGFCPTRLIEILNPDHARVVVTQEQSTVDSYASLSHCWGNSKRLKLETSNIDQLRMNINIDELPTTYREAIAVCTGLNLRYIWIDSLCIIQDSREDWKREALTMKDVYQNAKLNIAAASSAESWQPSLSERDCKMIQPVDVTTHWDDQENGKYYLVDAAMYEDEVEKSPLCQRAWVVQEIWLSRRNLYLTKNQLWWECCERVACEAFPKAIPEVWLSADWLESRKGRSSIDQETRWGKRSFVYRRWDELVETYTSSKITYPSDRMIAFTGILQHFQSVLEDDTCLAMHWRSKLPQSLAWYSRRGRWSYRPADYRAPSWSWASIEGRVEFAHVPELAKDGIVETVCTLLDVRIVSPDPAHGSDLRGGWLKLSGHLTHIGIHDTHLTVEEQDGSFGFIQGSTDDPSGRFHDENWSSIELDENTELGEPAVSYLTGLAEDSLLSGEFDMSRRTSLKAVELDNEIYALPILRWEQEGALWSRGLVLCEAFAGAQRVFQRIGSFTLSGQVMTAKVMEGLAEEVLII